jgi:hypothetical protein
MSRDHGKPNYFTLIERTAIMSSHKTLRLRLRKELVRLARNRLEKNLDALASREPSLRYRLPQDEIGELRRLPALMAAYKAAAQEQASTEQRRACLAHFTAYSAGVMIPVLARKDRYGDALELAEAHLELVLSRAFQDVAGAGSDVLDGEPPDPTVRMIVLSPTLWALLANYPDGPRPKNPGRLWAPSLEGFVQKLKCVETMNKCVVTSIAGLAALANAKRWFDLVSDGADAACSAGDHDLKDLFERILEDVEKKKAGRQGFPWIVH